MYDVVLFYNNFFVQCIDFLCESLYTVKVIVNEAPKYECFIKEFVKLM